MSEESGVDSLSAFIESRDEGQWTAQVVNRTEPEPIQRLVDLLFDGLSIDVTETELQGVDDDLFLLLRDGKVVESSPLSTLKETLLLVNSDLYTSGTAGIEEIEVPDVILNLSNTTFSLRGYPKADQEKLVLILVSRYIERVAWADGNGTLRTCFQDLSRLDEEAGTRQVYDRLGNHGDLDVHVYGQPDGEPPAEPAVTRHGVADPELRRHWFVIYQSAGAASLGMLAEQDDPLTWTGFWTVDDDDIDRLTGYVASRFE